MEASGWVGVVTGIVGVLVAVQAAGNAGIKRNIKADVSGPQARTEQKVDSVLEALNEHRNQMREHNERTDRTLEAMRTDHGNLRDRVGNVEGETKTFLGIIRSGGWGPPLK